MTCTMTPFSLSCLLLELKFKSPDRRSLAELSVDHGVCDSDGDGDGDGETIPPPLLLCCDEEEESFFFPVLFVLSTNFSNPYNHLMTINVL